MVLNSCHLTQPYKRYSSLPHLQHIIHLGSRWNHLKSSITNSAQPVLTACGWCTRSYHTKCMKDWKTHMTPSLPAWITRLCHFPHFCLWLLAFSPVKPSSLRHEHILLSFQDLAWMSTPPWNFPWSPRAWTVSSELLQCRNVLLCSVMLMSCHCLSSMHLKPDSVFFVLLFNNHI